MLPGPIWTFWWPWLTGGPGPGPSPDAGIILASAPPLFSRSNWADAAVLSGGAWEAMLPLAHLQDRQVQRKARSVDADPSSTTFDVDLGSIEAASVVALAGHNLTQLAQWRVRLSQLDPTFADAEFDSGTVDVWPQLVPFGALDWGVFNWGQSLPDVEAAALGGYAVVVLPAPTLFRYARVELFDGTNGDGFVEAGRFVLADAFQPTRGQRLGWSRQTVDPSRVTESRGGQRWFDLRRKRQRVDLEFQALSAAEMQVVDLFDRIVGVSGDVLVVLDPVDAGGLYRNTLLGTMAELSPLIGAYRGLAPYYGRRFVLEESI